MASHGAVWHINGRDTDTVWRRQAVARNLQKVPELVASRDSTYTWPNSSQRVSVFSPYEVGWFMTSLCERRRINGIKATIKSDLAALHLPSDLYA